MPGVFESMGATKGQRAALFYGLCIWVRLGLAYVVYDAALSSPSVTSLVVAGAAAMAAVYNGYNAWYSTNDVWWCRGCHAIIAAVLSVVAMLSYVGLVSPMLMPLIMVGDVVMGLMHSTMIFAL